MSSRCRARLGDSRARELDLEDPVAPVRAEDHRDVEPLARERPERLYRVERRAIRLERDHLAPGAGECGAGSAREALADRAAGEREVAVRGSAFGGQEMRESARRALVDHDRALRLERGQDGAEALRIERARRRRRVRSAVGRCGRRIPGAERVGERREGRRRVVLGRGQRREGSGRSQATPPVGVAEERHRLARASEDDEVEARQRLGRLLREVGEPCDPRHPSPALEPRREGLAVEPRPAHGGDARRGAEAFASQGLRAEQERRRARLAQAGGRRFHVSPGAARRGSAHRRRGTSGWIPLTVGGDDQRGDAARRAARRGERGGEVAREIRGRNAPAHEARDRRGQRLDVGAERRVEREVPARVVADQVDDRRARAPGVVQVGEPVGEAGPEMEQHEGGASRHAGIAVGRAGAHALEEPEHRPHAADRVERGHERHLGRPRVREAELDPGRDRGPHQALGAVHALPPGR